MKMLCLGDTELENPYRIRSSWSGSSAALLTSRLHTSVEQSLYVLCVCCV